MVVFEPSNIKIERQVITIKNLPQTFDGIKIVQLSDFHSLWFGSREKRVLKILEELEPDFVFITGDFVDPVTKAITDRELNSVKVFWQRLAEKYKNRIFGVLGNHDTGIVKNLLERSGITILDNENKKLFLDNDFIYPVRDSGNKNEGQKEYISNGVYLIGVDDPWTGRDDLSKAMEGVEVEVPKILLAHAAEIIDEAVEKNIDLVLVGHTHGGQVNILFLGELIQPLSKYGRQYTKGFFKIDSTYLYVNRGIGTSIFPVRFNCPPEITLIELRK
jgi:predicted MPP superfamily phosphohydrolase